MDKKKIKQKEELNKDKLFGIDTNESLQSVNFARANNSYLDQYADEEVNN